MRRVRTSTWVLTAVFLIALAAYVYLRPSGTAVSPGATRRLVHRGALHIPAGGHAKTHCAVTSTSPAPKSSPTHLAKTPHPTVVPTASPSPLGTLAPSATRSTSP